MRDKLGMKDTCKVILRKDGKVIQTAYSHEQPKKITLQDVIIKIIEEVRMHKEER